MENTLEKCGDDLTRENLMRQAAGHQKLKVPLLLPGITVSTSATDFYPVKAIRLARFTGDTLNLFGNVLAHETGRGGIGFWPGNHGRRTPDATVGQRRGRRDRRRSRHPRWAGACAACRAGAGRGTATGRFGGVHRA